MELEGREHSQFNATYPREASVLDLGSRMRWEWWLSVARMFAIDPTTDCKRKNGEHRIEKKGRRG